MEIYLDSRAEHVDGLVTSLTQTAAPDVLRAARGRRVAAAHRANVAPVIRDKRRRVAALAAVVERVRSERVVRGIVDGAAAVRGLAWAVVAPRPMPVLAVSDGNIYIQIIDIVYYTILYHPYTLYTYIWTQNHMYIYLNI